MIEQSITYIPYKVTNLNSTEPTPTAWTGAEKIQSDPVGTIGNPSESTHYAAAWGFNVSAFNPSPTQKIKGLYLSPVINHANRPVVVNVFRYTSINDAISIANANTGSTYPSSGDISQHISKMGAYTSQFGVHMRGGYLHEVTTRLKLVYIQYSANTPNTLSPNNVSRNPITGIQLSWRFVPSGLTGDNQVSSTIRYNTDDGAWKIITVSGTNSSYMLTGETLQGGSVLKWQVQTTSLLTGISGWSSTAVVTLTSTPPLAPVLVYPLDISVPAANGVLLEWRYNSPYDTTPIRFDVRYNLDGGEWIEESILGSVENPAQQSIMTAPIVTQNKVTWQVKAYGAEGDEGAWSEIGTFRTKGVPDKPIIVNVTNSNRPLISFSAKNLLSWELQIINDIGIIYDTGNQPFLDEFSHKTLDFLANGNYVVKMRVTNEYSLVSEWNELAFTINTVAPEALKLGIYSNPTYSIRLHFDNTNEKTCYIYRSEHQHSKYLKIGQTNASEYEDYTARPHQRYDYFVRVIGDNDSFADSSIVTGSLSFFETTIAEYDNLENMIMLKYHEGAKPTKDRSHVFEKTLTQFIGRNKPVLQVGNHTNKTLSLQFYCELEIRDKLEQLNESGKTLLLRDWRLGSVYGVISSELTDTPASSITFNGCIVSFTFAQTDFNKGADFL